MKIEINGEFFYICWRYRYGKKKIGNAEVQTRTTTCILKSNEDITLKANDKRKREVKDKKTLIERSVFSLDSETSKQKDRKLSLDKLLSSCDFSKEERTLIWNNYIASQNNDLSNDKISIKSLLKHIDKLCPEFKERIKNSLSQKEIENKVVTMHTEQVSAHA